jgi:hypothetical protein
MVEITGAAAWLINQTRRVDRLTDILQVFLRF